MAVRVLVVDDSVVVRRLVVQALESDPQIEVVGTAANGALAQTKQEQLQPDLITMDIEMPVMDGVEAVRELRRRGVRVPIIMFSTLTERGAVATLDALAAGATDYMTKPVASGTAAQSLAAVTEELCRKVRGLGGARVAGGAPRLAAPAPARAPRTRSAGPTPTTAIQAVVVGSSTGGPEALSTLVGALAEPLPVPVFIAQHMPPLFTAQLAGRLDRLGAATVVEATDGQLPVPGTIYIAPGDRHLELRVDSANRTVIGVTSGPPENFCRPAVDVLFRSAAVRYGAALLGVVLTGMGADGRVGSGAIVRAGGTVFAQDEPSSVVWGMPGAVVGAGFAHRILPIGEIGKAVVARVGSPEAFSGAVTR